MKTGSLLLLSIFLYACAAPGHVKDKAQQIMGSGTCYQLFTGSSLGSYQHCTHQLGGRCVFALAIDKNSSSNQACSFARGLDLLDHTCVFNCLPTWAQLEALAIARCEQYRKNVSNSCEIFARDNEIIWQNYKTNDVNFQ